MLDARLNRVRSTFNSIDRAVGAGELVLSNGRCITAEDLEVLYKVQDYLEARFARHLNLLRSRAGK